MLKPKVGLFIFVVIALFSKYCSDAANSDEVLTFFGKEGGDKAYIAITPKSTQGKAISVCSWINAPQFAALLNVRKAISKYVTLGVIINYLSGFVYGANFNAGNFKINRVDDCNLINFKSWAHLCVILNQSTLSFYFNGLPLKNYTFKDDIVLEKDDNLEVLIGDTYSQGVKGSLYQLNLFDRMLTVQEAEDLYHCKSIEGDIVKWTDITSKTGFQFNDNITLEKAEVPCPDPPPYNPINCTTGEPLRKSEAIGGSEGTATVDPGSANLDPGSSSGFSDPGSSSGYVDAGSSSENGDPGSSSENGDPGSSSENGDPGSSSENGDPGSSAGIGQLGSSAGNVDPEKSSEDENLGKNQGSSGS